MLFIYFHYILIITYFLFFFFYYTVIFNETINYNTKLQNDKLNYNKKQSSFLKITIQHLRSFKNSLLLLRFNASVFKNDIKKKMINNAPLTIESHYSNDYQPAWIFPFHPTKFQFSYFQLSLESASKKSFEDTSPLSPRPLVNRANHHASPTRRYLHSAPPLPPSIQPSHWETSRWS